MSEERTEEEDVEAILKLFVFKDIGCKLNIFNKKNPKITLAIDGFGLHKGSTQDILYVLNVKLHLGSVTGIMKQDSLWFYCPLCVFGNR